MAISNCLFWPTLEIPVEFPTWCVLAKFIAKTRNYSQPRPLVAIAELKTKRINRVNSEL